MIGAVCRQTDWAWIVFGLSEFASLMAVRQAKIALHEVRAGRLVRFVAYILTICQLHAWTTGIPSLMQPDSGVLERTEYFDKRTESTLEAIPSGTLQVYILFRRASTTTSSQINTLLVSVSISALSAAYATCRFCWGMASLVI